MEKKKGVTMHPYKAVFLLLSVLLFIHAYRGVAKGTIYVKGMYVDRDRSPFWFWVSIGTILLFAFALLIFAFIAKYR